jgi:hypothetical protein
LHEILSGREFVTICEQAFRRVLPRESLMLPGREIGSPKVSSRANIGYLFGFRNRKGQKSQKTALRRLVPLRESAPFAIQFLPSP